VTESSLEFHESAREHQCLSAPRRIVRFAVLCIDTKGLGHHSIHTQEDTHDEEQSDLLDIQKFYVIHTLFNNLIVLGTIAS